MPQELKLDRAYPSAEAARRALTAAHFYPAHTPPSEKREIWVELVKGGKYTLGRRVYITYDAHDDSWYLTEIKR